MDKDILEYVSAFLSLTLRYLAIFIAQK